MLISCKTMMTPRPRSFARTMDQRQHLDLMRDIKRRDRFVQQQAFGILSHQHREPDPLALAAGEGINQAIAERSNIGQCDRFGDLDAIDLTETAESAVPGITPKRHQLAH